MSTVDSYGTISPPRVASADDTHRRILSFAVRGFTLLPAPILGAVFLNVDVPFTCDSKLSTVFHGLGVLNICVGSLSILAYILALIHDWPAALPTSAVEAPEGAGADEQEPPMDTYSAVPMLLELGAILLLDCCWVYGVYEVHGASATLCGNAVTIFWIFFIATVAFQLSWPYLTYRTLDPKESDVKARRVLDYVVFAFAILLVAAAVIARMTSPGPRMVGALPGFNEWRAAEYARLSGAVYCSKESINDWDCGLNCIRGVRSPQLCNGKSTKAMVVKLDTLCAVAFEGTKAYWSYLTDVKFWKSTITWDLCDNCKIHSGFLEEWLSFKDCIKEQLEASGCPKGSRIGVTGHSLGAAVSTLATLALEKHGWKVAESMNFGSPRVGDKKWATYFSKKFAGRFYRITHRKDPVVHVPPKNLFFHWGFEHVEPEVFYEGNVSGGYKICTRDNDKHCSAKYYNVLLDTIADHSDYMNTIISSTACS